MKQISDGMREVLLDLGTPEEAVQKLDELTQ